MSKIEPKDIIDIDSLSGFDLEFNLNDLSKEAETQSKCKYCNTRLILDINNRCINCGASK